MTSVWDVDTDMVRLMHGDCLERMAEITDGSVDLILTDPPYGMTRNKWDAVIPFDLMWHHLWRVATPTGVTALTAAQPYTSALVMSNPQHFKYCWTWRKSQGTGFLNANKQPLRVVEDVAVFYRKQCYYSPQMVEGAPYSNQGIPTKSSNYGAVNRIGAKNTSTRYPTQILEFKSVQRTAHPTQKPVALMRYLIETYTRPGDTVLDFTMGSGSTGVACVDTGRRFIGIERDETYYRGAVARILSHKKV